MSVQILLMTVLSSLAWSLLDASRKKLAENLEPVQVAIWLMLLPAFLYLGFAFVESWQLPSSLYWGVSVAGIVLNSFANVLFVRALVMAPLSLAVPFLSLTPVFSAIGAFLLLDEPTTVRQAIGILVIVLSAFALGRAGVSREPEVHGHTAEVRRGILYMVIVALLWATTFVLDKMCLREIAPSQHALIQSLGIALVLIIWLKIRGRELAFTKLRASWRWLILAVAMAAIALLAQFLAIRSMPVGIFESLKRSVGLVSALTLGRLLFNEPITRVKALIVLSMGVGIVILLS